MTHRWEDLITQPELAPESLRQAFRAALAGHAELADVSPADDALTLNVVTRGGNRCAVDLTNLFADAQRALPEERGGLFQQHVATALETARTTDGAGAAPSIDQLVPTVKGQSWVDTARSMGNLAIEPLVADLHVAYAFDRKHSIAYASESDLVSLGIDHPTLRQTALDNLRRLLPKEISTRGDGKSFIFTAGGNYEASLLLLDEVWDQLSLPGSILACALTRDICLVTGTGVAGGLDSLRSAADRICAAGPPSNYISRTILQRDARAWRPFQPT